MKDYIHIGSTPACEDCAQVGAEDYRERSRRELTAFTNQIKRVYPVPENLANKVSFGLRDGEVVVYYKDNSKMALDYALKIEGSKKLHYWDEEAEQELSTAEAKPTKLAKGEFVFVGVIPKCDIPGCSNQSAYDAKTNQGPWGYVCEKHFGSMQCSLGVGRGQKLFLMSEKAKIVAAGLVDEMSPVKEEVDV